MTVVCGLLNLRAEHVEKDTQTTFVRPELLKTQHSVVDDAINSVSANDLECSVIFYILVCCCCCFCFCCCCSGVVKSLV